MRRIIFLVLCGWCLTAQAADFRQAQWGMSVNEVKALHSGELSANQGRRMVEYEAKLGDLDVLIFYRFDGLGRLYQAGYRSIEDHDDINLHISDFQALNALLRRKYPQSDAVVEQWQNPMFKAKPEQWGRAIKLGHLSFAWSYQNDRTRTEHILSGDRRSITHVVRYEHITEPEDAAQAGAADVLDEL